MFFHDKKLGYSFSYDYRNFFDFESAADEVRQRVRFDFIDNMSYFLTKRVQLNAYTARAVAASTFSRMADYNLHYHTPVHVLSLFLCASSFSNVFKFDVAFELAVWFHDVIYDPRDKDGINELQSSCFMRAVMPQGTEFQNTDVSRAEKLIECTEYHLKRDVPESAHLMMDLDLMSLAFNAQSYKVVSQCIRKEAENFVTPQEYEYQRRLFLRGMLNKDTIYRKFDVRSYCETRARKNIRAELEALKPTLTPTSVDRAHTATEVY